MQKLTNISLWKCQNKPTAKQTLLNAKNKPDPKKHLSIQKLKLLPTDSKTTCCVKQKTASISKDAKSTNAHSSSTRVNLLGIVVFFATKIKESSKISGKHFWKISRTKMKKPPIVSWDSTIMAEEFLSVTQPSLGQLTNLTNELSSSHEEREASRVQSARLDSAAIA